MAKLSDLIHISDQRFITIQGVDVPAMFTFESIHAIEDAYGTGYTQFEKDLNMMLKRKVIDIKSKKVQKLVWSLVYGLLIGGGTEATYEEMNRAIPFTEIPSVIKQAMDILNDQNFQASDQKK